MTELKIDLIGGVGDGMVYKVNSNQLTKYLKLTAPYMKQIPAETSLNVTHFGAFRQHYIERHYELIAFTDKRFLLSPMYYYYIFNRVSESQFLKLSFQAFMINRGRLSSLNKINNF